MSKNLGLIQSVCRELEDMLQFGEISVILFTAKARQDSSADRGVVFTSAANPAHHVNMQIFVITVCVYNMFNALASLLTDK